MGLREVRTGFLELYQYQFVRIRLLRTTKQTENSDEQCNRKKYGTIFHSRHWVSHNSASTSSAWSAGFTFGHIFLILPSGPIKNVTRDVPVYFTPMNVFGPHTPYACTIFFPSSASSVYGSLNFSTNLSCDLAESVLTPSTTAPFPLKSSHRSRNEHASLLQPGVLSFG